MKINDLLLSAYIARFVLFGKDDGRVVKILRGDARQPDAAGLDREDLVDRPSGKAAGKFLSHSLIERNVDLMIQKAVDL